MSSGRGNRLQTRLSQRNHAPRRLTIENLEPRRYLTVSSTTGLSVSPSRYGTPLVLTATATAGSTGTVTFSDGGTSVGSADLQTDPGKALGFSSASNTSYVTVGSSSTLDSLTDGSNKELTLAAWIDPAADMDNSGIIYKGPLTGSQGTFQVSFAHGVGYPNELNFRLNGSTTSGDGQLTSSTYIPDNTWTFVACTYDGTEQKIYINGALNASASYTAALQTDTNGLAIGIYNSNTSTYNSHYLTFDGGIDEVDAWK